LIEFTFQVAIRTHPTVAAAQTIRRADDNRRPNPSYRNHKGTAMHQPSLLVRGLFGAASIGCTLSIAAGVTPVATASTSARRAAASAAPCSTSQLVVWLDTVGNGAAGSVSYDLEFTNLWSHSCSLFGYPGVSAVDLAGRQLGSAASRDAARAARRVSLAPGHTVSAAVRIVEPGNFPSASCHPAAAAGLRVFPPNTTASKVVPFPFVACSRSGPTYLFVRVVR
jgi:hypothetical protein